MQGKVYGENELPNFSKGIDDKLTFEALFNPSEGHTISLEEMILHFPSFGSDISFANSFCQEAFCEDVSDPNLPSKRCKCISNWGYYMPINIVFKYDENNNGIIDSTTTVNFFPDNIKPVFEQISLTQVEEGIEFNYIVKDEACENCNTCSGIKEVIVADNTGPIATFNINSSSCQIERTDFFEYNVEGTITFDFIVRDRLWKNSNDNQNHQSISTRTFSLDYTPPVISSKFQVYKNNEKVSYINSNGINGATISFTVEDKNLYKISAKLSDLGNNNNVPLTSYESYCNHIGNNLYNCSFNNINIINPNVELEVTAIDIRDNSKISSLSSNLILDDVKPSVEFLGTIANHETQSYVKNGENTFIVRAIETNSGLSKENVRLNLGAFNLGNSVQADECVLENSKWVCKWTREINNIQDGSSYLITLGTSYDNAGNSFEGISQATLIADTKIPDVEEIEIYAIGELGLRTYFQSNDILNIKAYVKKEGSPLKSAKANFSQIYSGTSSLVNGNCNLIEGNKYLCEWETNQIKAGYYIARINFIFEDVALNINKIEKSIAVYGISTNVPNNFDVTINRRDIIPNSINRMVASLLPNPPGYKIIVPFTLTGGGNDIKILNYYVDNCNIDGDISAYNNMFKDSRNPTPDRVPLLKSTNQSTNSLEFTLGHFTGPELNLLNDFDISCSINIYQSQKTHDGHFTFSHPEIKNVSFKLKVSGSALDGKPGEKVIEEIQKKREGIIKSTQFITDGVKIVNQLESICSYASKLMGIWSVFAGIEELGAGLVLVNEKFEPVYKVGCFLYEGYGSMVARLYYGSLDGRFSIKNCASKLDIISSTSDASVVGARGRLPTDDPRLVSEAIGKWTKEGGGFTFPGIRNICGFVSCEYSTKLANNISKYTAGDQLFFPPKTGEDDSDNSWIEGYFQSLLSFPRNAPSFNPRNSIVMSLASSCIPGIFYNLNKYRQIECDYIICLKETAVAGGPISICKDQRRQNTCLVFFGEAYESIGILRLASSIGSYLSSTAIDLLPQGLKALYDQLVCNKKGTEEGNAASMRLLIATTCTLPRAIHNLIDSYNRVKGMGRYGDADTWKFSRREIPDSCEIVLSEDFIEGLSVPTLDLED